MSSVEVVAPVPLVTTIARDPEEAVLLFMQRADPVVAPLMLTNTSVVEAVIAELVIVRVRSAAAAIETEVKVALPDLPLTTTGDAAAPDACEEFRRIPVPAAVATKFPSVVVIAPNVAVSVVEVVREPVTAVFPVAFPNDNVPVPPVAIDVAAAPVVFKFVVPAESNVVACTGRGVVLPKPKTGGEAKSNAVADCAVAGEIATFSRTPAAASAAVAKRTMPCLYCVPGWPL